MLIVKPGDNFKSGEPTSAALGFFDGVHIGHAAVIRAAKEKGLKTVVATFTRRPGDFFGEKSSGALMGTALKQRAFAQLGADILYYLDFLKVKDMPPEDFVGEILSGCLNARFVSCGFNYRFGKGGTAGPAELARLCGKKGIGVTRVDAVKAYGGAVSSTRIRGLIEKGDLETARRLMGRPFALYEKVVHGKKLGRAIGSPTINQRFPAGHIIPRLGVYISAAHVDGKVLPAVTNVGVRPTVDGKGLNAETHILDFEGNLYGEDIQVDFIQFMRPEIKFKSVEQLKTQIARDTAAARTVKLL